MCWDEGDEYRSDDDPGYRLKELYYPEACVDLHNQFRRQRELDAINRQQHLAQQSNPDAFAYPPEDDGGSLDFLTGRLSQVSCKSGDSNNSSIIFKN